MEVQVTIPAEMERYVMALATLRPQDLELVGGMAVKLAAREGFDFKVGQRLARPIDGMPLWRSKLRQEGYSDGTIATYSSTLSQLLGEVEAPNKLDMQAWLARRLETLSANTVATDRKAMRSLFGFLFDEGLWPSDPTIRLNSVKVTYHSREAPTEAEMQMLMGYRCQQPEDTVKYQMMTLLLATTGLRVTEGASLRRDRIYFGSDEVKVIGKGDKEGVIPLVGLTARALRAYIDSHPTSTPYLFPGEGDNKYWSISCYEKTVKRACRALGLQDYTPHSIRHFYATYMLSHGAKMEVVSRLLRHSSIGTTMDIYRHVLPAEMRQEVDRFAPMALSLA